MNSELVPFIPLIAALLAVVLTTLGNTGLEWLRQTWQHNREAETIRRAFAQELRLHRAIVQNATPEWEPNPDESVCIPADHFFPVYDNLMNKLGMLKPEEVEAVLKAYSQLLLAPKNLSLIGRVRKDELSLFYMVDRRYFSVVKNMLKNHLTVIDEALGVLTAKGKGATMQRKFPPDAPVKGK